MKITNFAGRELTESEMMGFHWHIDFLKPEWRDKIIYALCGNETIIEILKENAADPSAQIAEAKRIMHENLCNSPDYATCVYTDGSGSISMDGGRIVKIIFDRPQEEIETGSMDFTTGYMNRQSILEACSEGKVLALAEYGEEKNSAAK